MRVSGSERASYIYFKKLSLLENDGRPHWMDDSNLSEVACLLMSKLMEGMFSFLMGCMRKRKLKNVWKAKVKAQKGNCKLCESKMRKGSFLSFK